MARYNGSGWHRQSIRHSNARKYGKAGGKYAKVHILGNKITNFENPSIEEIKRDGWMPIYDKKGKIVDWKLKPFSGFEIDFNEGLNKYEAVFFDENGESIIYRGTKKGCEEYIKQQKKRLKEGKLIKESSTIWKKNFGYASRGFKTFQLKDGYEIIAHWEKTRNGFRHIAILMKDGAEVDRAKATYLNRTWESYEYQSVINTLLNKTKILSEQEKKAFLQKGEMQAKKEAEEMFGNIGAIAKLGEIMTGSQKEANTWKERMIKAGLGEGIQMPEDWNTLSEDEKEARLNKVIEFMKPKKKNYGKTKWKSIYEAPIEKIEREFKQAYGRKPTSLELNDIVLEGEF